MTTPPLVQLVTETKRMDISEWFLKLNLKVYRWNSTPENIKTEDLIKQALSEDFINGQDAERLSPARSDRLGMAFTFGYQTSEGQVLGVDFMTYRTIDLLGDSKVLQVDKPTMVHTWAMERPAQAGGQKFTLMDAGKNGAMCLPESIILGRESEILDNLIGMRVRPGGQVYYVVDLERYLNTWPDLGKYERRR